MCRRSPPRRARQAATDALSRIDAFDDDRLSDELADGEEQDGLIYSSEASVSNDSSEESGDEPPAAAPAAAARGRGRGRPAKPAAARGRGRAGRVASLFDRQRFFMLRKFHHPAKPNSANAKVAQGFDNLHQVAPMLASLLETCQGTLDPESGKAHSLDEETLNQSCKIIIKKSERWRPETLVMPYEGF